jgi:hypothetical protein
MDGAVDRPPSSALDSKPDHKYDLSIPNATYMKQEEKRKKDKNHLCAIGTDDNHTQTPDQSSIAIFFPSFPFNFFLISIVHFPRSWLILVRAIWLPPPR